MSGFVNNIVSEKGEQFIPPSQRPDGTWRKARRIKEGYIPQEEVPLYESKGKLFVEKQTKSVILASGEVADRYIPGFYMLQADTKKKRAKKTSVQLCNQMQDLEIADNINEYSSTSEKAQKNVGTKATELTDPTKKLKNLKKKLREIESLQEKISNRLISKPEQEQLAKIKRKNDLLMQICELEKQLQ